MGGGLDVGGRVGLAEGRWAGGQAGGRAGWRAGGGTTDGYRVVNGVLWQPPVAVRICMYVRLVAGGAMGRRCACHVDVCGWRRQRGDAGRDGRAGRRLEYGLCLLAGATTCGWALRVGGRWGRPVAAGGGGIGGGDGRGLAPFSTASLFSRLRCISVGDAPSHYGRSGRATE